jgi:hypothetical protein
MFNWEMKGDCVLYAYFRFKCLVRVIYDTVALFNKAYLQLRQADSLEIFRCMSL